VSGTSLDHHPALGFWQDIESVTIVSDACLIAKRGYYGPLG
jgi:hypothetical protein